MAQRTTEIIVGLFMIAGCAALLFLALQVSGLSPKSKQAIDAPRAVAAASISCVIQRCPSITAGTATTRYAPEPMSKEMQSSALVDEMF